MCLWTNLSPASRCTSSLGAPNTSYSHGLSCFRDQAVTTRSWLRLGTRGQTQWVTEVCYCARCPPLASLLSKLFNTSGPCVGCVHYLETPAAFAGQRCSSGHHPLWQQSAGVSGCPDQVKALCLPVAMEIGTSSLQCFCKCIMYILLCLHPFV